MNDFEKSELLKTAKDAKGKNGFYTKSESRAWPEHGLKIKLVDWP